MRAKFVFSTMFCVFLMASVSMSLTDLFQRFLSIDNIEITDLEGGYLAFLGAIIVLTTANAIRMAHRMESANLSKLTRSTLRVSGKASIIYGALILLDWTLHSLVEDPSGPTRQFEFYVLKVPVWVPCNALAIAGIILLYLVKEVEVPASADASPN